MGLCTHKCQRAYADQSPHKKTNQFSPSHAYVKSLNLPQRSAQLITLAESSFPSVATLLSVRAGETANDTHRSKLGLMKQTNACPLYITSVYTNRPNTQITHTPQMWLNPNINFPSVLNQPSRKRSLLTYLLIWNSYFQTFHEKLLKRSLGRQQMQLKATSTS